jgi:hypothetical protein
LFPSFPHILILNSLASYNYHCFQTSLIGIFMDRRLGGAGVTHTPANHHLILSIWLFPISFCILVAISTSNNPPHLIYTPSYTVVSLTVSSCRKELNRFWDGQMVSLRRKVLFVVENEEVVCVMEKSYKNGLGGRARWKRLKSLNQPLFLLGVHVR